MGTTGVAAQGAQLSFFARVKQELAKLFQHVPGWQASAAATLTYVAPLVETVLALVDPAALPAATLLIEKVQSAMAAAAVVVKDAGPKPTLITYLNAINHDLAQLESAAGVTNSANAQKLAATLATITAEVNAILLAVTPVQP